MQTHMQTRGEVQLLHRAHQQAHSVYFDWISASITDSLHNVEQAYPGLGDLKA
jgi:hypothetical protein